MGNATSVPIQFQGPCVSEHTYSENASVSLALVLTASDIYSGGIEEHTLNLTGAISTNSTVQLPTVASLVSAIGASVVGQTYKLRIINNAGTAPWTVIQASDASWTLNGIMIVGIGALREFYVAINSSTTATIQDITGAGAAGGQTVTIPGPPTLAATIVQEGTTVLSEVVLYGLGAGGPVRLTTDGNPANSSNCLNIPTQTSLFAIIDILALANPGVISSYSGLIVYADRIAGNIGVASSANPASSTPGELHAGINSSVGQSVTFSADTINQGINITFIPPSSNLTNLYNVAARARVMQMYNTTGASPPFLTETMRSLARSSRPMLQSIHAMQNMLTRGIP